MLIRDRIVMRVRRRHYLSEFRLCILSQTSSSRSHLYYECGTREFSKERTALNRRSTFSGFSDHNEFESDCTVGIEGPNF